MRADMTAVTYNLTKLFQMKLRQLSATRAILQRKMNETFGQPNTYVILTLAVFSHHCLQHPILTRTFI